MAKVSIATLDKAERIASPDGQSLNAQGDIVTRVMLAGPAHPIHLVVHDLAADARLTLAGGSVDLALFVWKGAVEAGGAQLDAKSSAVIERGASLDITAGREGASAVVFQLGERDGGAAAGGHVHILPHDRVPRTDRLGGNDGIGGALHSDAQCPTCSVWLHENSYAMADKETPVHSHSEDEVIFVHTGSIRLGNRVYGPGTALAIAANTKYGFFSGPDGLGFVNFRATSPTYTSGDGSVVMDEAELWRGLLGQPHYLEPVS